MGVIHQQGHAPGLTDLGDALDIADHPKVIRTGDIDGGCIGAGLEGLLHRLGGIPPGEPGAGAVIRIDPHRFQIQQGHGVHRRTVQPAAGHQLLAGAAGQGQHRLDAEGAASGAEQRPAGPIELCQLFFQGQNRPLGVIEVVAPLHFGDVPFQAGAGIALVARDMEAGTLLIQIVLYRQMQRLLLPRAPHRPILRRRERSCPAPTMAASTSFAVTGW